MPTPSATAKYQSHPSVQSSSIFFSRLPREIRDLIYNEVIRAEDQPVHLFLYNDRSNHYRSSLGVKPNWDMKTVPRSFTPIPRSGRVTGIDRAKENNLEKHQSSHYTLTWLLSCKQIFSEAFYLLFFVPTIWIHDICTFEKWWTTLPPTSFTKIHSLHLEVVTLCQTVFATTQLGYRGHQSSMVLDYGRWATLWDTIATMKGLGTLHVKLSKLPHARFSQETNRDILEPFMAMKGPRRFTVSVTWHLEEQFLKEYQENAPFDLSCAVKDP